MAASEETPLQAVQLEALTVMKTIKHCATRHPATATGFLVGMDNNSLLEITNCFPFPVVDLPPEAQYEQQHFNSAAAAPRAKANTAYQAEMIRMQKEVGVDANNVGWYTSANLGNFVNSNFIENQYFYQKEVNERTVALVHDVSRSSQGALSMRAFRLSPQFVASYKENKFTTEAYVFAAFSRVESPLIDRRLQKSGLKYSDIIIELPIRLHNAHNVTTFLNQVPRLLSKGIMSPPTSVSSIETNPAVASDDLAPSFDKLALNIDPFLQQTCDNLLDSIETHHVESNNFSYYARALGREQTKIQQWQAKRKAENAARAISKQTPLPEDEWQKLFKLPTEPSRLESMLNSRQVEQYARQVDGFVAGTSGKMFAVRGNLIPGEAGASGE